MRALASWPDWAARRLSLTLPPRLGMTPQGLLFGVRLAASVCLALYAAFWFQLDAPYWAATSASVVAQPGLGASLRKARFRAVGTIVGGVVIVALVAALPQSPIALLACLILWACVCGYFATVLSNFASYAAALAGYTAAVVFASIVNDPQGVFMVAVWRVTEIGIGIVAAVLVHTLTDFGTARARLARAFAEIGEAIAAGLVRTLTSTEVESSLRVTRRALIQRVIALGPTVDEAIGEPTHVRSYLGTLQATVEACFVALSAWRSIANHLNAPGRAATPASAADLLPHVSELAQVRWSTSPGAARECCRTLTRLAEEMPTPDLSARLVLGGIARTAEALERVAHTLEILEGLDRDGGRGEPPRTRIHAPDLMPSMINALRIAFALAVADTVWIVTAWPDGPRMITFTAVGVILFSARPHDAYPSAVDYAVGTALAGVLAAILNLAVLPGLHGDFLSLAIVLCVTFIPLGALAAGRWHTLVFVALATNLMPILSTQNARSYEAAETLNVALAMFAGTAVAALLLLLIPPLTPAQRIRRLLTLSLRDVRALVAGRRAFKPERWVARISGRLEWMPREAALEEDAQLLAAFSVGEAAISLRQRPVWADDGALRGAFAAFDRGDVAIACAQLAAYSQASRQITPKVSADRLAAAVEATVIEDAIRRHPHFFGREE